MVFLLFLASAATLEFILRHEAKAVRYDAPPLPPRHDEAPVQRDLMALMKALETTSPPVVSGQPAATAEQCVPAGITEDRKL